MGKHRVITAIILLFMTINLASCQGKDEGKYYSWDAKWGAPKHFSAQLVTGGIINEEDNYIPFETGSIMDERSGWGNCNNEGMGSRCMPKSIELLWLSPSEEKFYIGEFDLPTDSICQLFEEGFNHVLTKEHTTYDEIKVGMAPGGVVAVWLSGPGKQVEVGLFHAKETEYSIGKILGGRGFNIMEGRTEKDYPQVLKEWCHALNTGSEYEKRLYKDALSMHLWDSVYRQKYNLRVVLEYPNVESDCITDEVDIEYLNGEREFLVLEDLAQNPFKLRAVPRYIRYTNSNLDDNGEREYNMSEIDFNELDLYRVLNKVLEGNPNRPIELRIVRSYDNMKHSRMYMTSCDPENNSRSDLNMDIHMINNYIIRPDYFEIYKESLIIKK